MKIGLQDVDWGYVGALLARGDDNEQAEFFRAFVNECETWGTNFQIEQQLAAVNIKLTKKERGVLSMLGYEDQP